MKNKSIIKNSIFNILYVGMNLLFPLITSIYIGRILLPVGVGKVSYAQNVASYFVSFAALGLPSYGLREISKVRNAREKLNKTFSELIIINSISTILVAIAYIFIVLIIPSYRKEILLYLACGIPVVLNVFDVDWFYQGLEDYEYITVRSIAIKIISIILMFIFIKDRSDYVLYAFIVSLATVGNYIFNIVHARNIVKFNFHAVCLKKHVRPLINFAFIIILSSIYSKIDILMLGYFADNKSIGYYSYGQKIVNIILMACNAATTVLMPRLSLYYANNRDQFYNLIKKGIKVITFISFPVCVGMFFLSKPVILVLFGEAFENSINVVKWFTPIILIKTYGDLLCYQILISTGNEKQSIYASVIGSIINVVLNFLLIPRYHEVGAVFASVLAEFSLNLYEFIFTKKNIGYKLPLREIFQAFVTSILMGGVLLLLQLFIQSNILNIILGVFAGIFVYFCINMFLKNSVSLFIVKKLQKII